MAMTCSETQEHTALRQTFLCNLQSRLYSNSWSRFGLNCSGSAILFAYSLHCLSQWPRGLRRGSAAPLFLGLPVRILQKLGFVSCNCCVLSSRGLCVAMITRKKAYQWKCCVWVWTYNLDNEEVLANKVLVLSWKKIIFITMAHNCEIGNIVFTIFIKVTRFKKDSAATTRSHVTLMLYFLWTPVENALSVFHVNLLC